jgi:N-acyl-L-homoserine lactone synthetase
MQNHFEEDLMFSACLLQKNTVTMQGESSVLIHENGHTAKNLITEKEKIQAYHLRHETFAGELRWVPETENGLEIDDYDSHALPFGVVDAGGHVVAHMRIITGDNTYMLEREFLSLAGAGHVIRKEADTAELTRCCVSKSDRNTRLVTPLGDFDLFSYLLKGIYRWSLKNGIRYLYAVTDHRVFKLVQIKGLPFKAIGAPQVMPDGVIAVAILLDWREFEVQTATRRKNLLPWFTQYPGAPGRALQQQHAPDSQHQVSGKDSLYEI